MESAVFLMVLLVTLLAGQTFPQGKVDKNNIPQAIVSCMETQKLSDKYEVDGRMNPFYLRGDFDGDRKSDCAILIREKGSEKKGILICHSLAPRVAVLGAGSKFVWDDDLSWMNAWQVYGKRSVEQGVGEGPPPKLLGEAILAERQESASGLIYWNGKRFVWYQQGD